MYTDITDHFPIFYIDNSCLRKRENLYVTKRFYNRNNVEKFKNDLSNDLWNDVLAMQDAQSVYSLFFQKLADMYNKRFPLKRVRSSYYNRKPWLTEGLKLSIKVKNRLHARCKKHPNTHNEMSYTIYKRTLQKTLRFAEREYYDKKFNEYKSDLVKS